MENANDETGEISSGEGLRQRRKMMPQIDIPAPPISLSSSNSNNVTEKGIRIPTDGSFSSMSSTPTSEKLSSLEFRSSSKTRGKKHFWARKGHQVKIIRKGIKYGMSGTVIDPHNEDGKVVVRINFDGSTHVYDSHHLEKSKTARRKSFFENIVKKATKTYENIKEHTAVESGRSVVVTNVVYACTAYIIGYLNYPILVAIVLALFVSYYTYKFILLRRKQRRQQAMAHFVQMNNDGMDSDILKLMIGEIPGWVRFPDMESTKWINVTMKKLWPALRSCLDDYLIESFNPLLHYYKPESVTLMEFTKFDLGKLHPVIRGIRHQRDTKKSAILDVEMRFVADETSEIRMRVVAGVIKMPVIIRHLDFTGIIRFEFSGIRPPLPGFDEMRVSFVQKPTINFDLSAGHKTFDLMHMPFFEGALTDFVDECISWWTYPSAKITPMRDSTEELEPAKGYDVVGDLSVTILAIREIEDEDAAAERRKGKTSKKRPKEYFVQSNFNDIKKKTPITKTCQWHEDNIFRWIVKQEDVDLEHNIALKVKAHRLLGGSQMIGAVHIPLHHLKVGEITEQWTRLWSHRHVAAKFELLVRTDLQITNRAAHLEKFAEALDSLKRADRHKVISKEDEDMDAEEKARKIRQATRERAKTFSDAHAEAVSMLENGIINKEEFDHIVKVLNETSPEKNKMISSLKKKGVRGRFTSVSSSSKRIPLGKDRSRAHEKFKSDPSSKLEASFFARGQNEIGVGGGSRHKASHFAKATSEITCKLKGASDVFKRRVRRLSNNFNPMRKKRVGGLGPPGKTDLMRQFVTTSVGDADDTSSSNEESDVNDKNGDSTVPPNAGSNAPPSLSVAPPSHFPTVPPNFDDVFIPGPRSLDDEAEKMSVGISLESFETAFGPGSTGASSLKCSSERKHRDAMDVNDSKIGASEEGPVLNGDTVAEKKGDAVKATGTPPKRAIPATRAADVAPGDSGNAVRSSASIPPAATLEPAKEDVNASVRARSPPTPPVTKTTAGEVDAASRDAQSMLGVSRTAKRESGTLTIVVHSASSHFSSSSSPEKARTPTKRGRFYVRAGIHGHSKKSHRSSKSMSYDVPIWEENSRDGRLQFFVDSKDIGSGKGDALKIALVKKASSMFKKDRVVGATNLSLGSIQAARNIRAKRVSLSGATSGSYLVLSLSWTSSASSSSSPPPSLG